MNKIADPILTIFTPAYNRAHTLPRTYESLCRQSCKDFIWLVVDDGSTDNTAAFVQQLLLAKVSCEFHLFERGVHDMALADETSASKPEDVNAEAARWVELAAAWLALDGSPEAYEI